MTLPSLQRLQSITSHMVSTTTTTSTTSKKVSKPIISFIGGGNMAEAILAGLQSSGHPSKNLRYSEPFQERLDYMKSKYPNLVGSNNTNEIVQDADVVILAVKPQVLRSVVINDISSLVKKKPDLLIVSIAAGITTSDIHKWLNIGNNPASIVRCMPNTPALVGEGAAGLYATDSVNNDQRDMTEDVMKAVAKEVSWVSDESLIDTVTGISGSGPAYFFLIMEAMQNAGMKNGLSLEDAKALTIQTCLGAARMASTSEDDLSTLRRKVTSPKGTTEAAINSMESNNIRKVMSDAVDAAQNRGKELAEQLGKEL